MSTAMNRVRSKSWRRDRNHNRGCAMSDVRELLGRLNQQTVKFDVGRGGVAELTNQDIAAALAFVPAGLGREVLEACWWPDGACGRRTKLRDAVMALVMPELARQSRLLSSAHLDLQLAEAAVAWSRHSTAEQRSEVDRLRARLESTRARCWPRNAVESLPTLTGAVLSEIATRNLCPCCEGRGERLMDELLVPCVECKGRGVVPISDRKRAKAIGRDESTFRELWRPVYLWLLDHITAAEQEAAGQLSKALRREAA